ncbi:MAG: penicillin acylase family protein [Chloroflexi bacterium]|nr:penicillin acylase family protein [Chloroflexota bacterium]
MNLLHRLTAACLKPTLLYMSRNRLPQVSGRLYLPGLKREVVIRRDRWGIPHIHAANRHDLFFAQGFVHAQDRLWQMELNRRAASGRLSALLGEIALETDRLTRTLGFGRLARAAWDTTGDLVRHDALAYSAGVNAYLAQNPKLPVEFALLRHRPEPWDPLDSLTFGRMLAWTLSYGWAGELARARLVEKVGPELAAELEPRYPERNPLTLPQGIQFNRLEPDGMLRAAAGPFLGRGAEGGGRGSNGWVISPRRSATGHAILCNDPHLPLTGPGLWYYLHLRSEAGQNEPALHVAGVSQAGVPYVLVGHNDHIAWGATLSFADCEDLFVEKLDPADPTRYEFQGQWRAAQLFEEPIQVKGRPDHVERVVVTHHGPLISRALAGGLEPGPNLALALNAIALHPYETFDGFALLNQARHWDDFVAAVHRIESPSLNLIYADTSDNIGYYVSGRLPVRAKGQGLVPAPGWTGEYEWTGVIPFEEMPHALNPAQGFLVTANHRIIGDDYPHYLGSVWMNGYRARRLEQLITAQEKISLEDCRRFHLDFHSIPGRELVERLAGLEPEDPDAALSLDLLRQWDGWLGAGSAGGAVYEIFLACLSRTILEPNLGRELALELLGQGPHPLLYPISEFYGYWTVTLLRLLDNPQTAWLPGRTGRQAILLRCLAQTTVELRRLLGDDPRRWHWGRLHQVRFPHAMGLLPPLDQVFNQGPRPIGGDTNTITQTAIAPGQGYENNAFSVSYRQIVDLGHLANSLAIHPPGQSGHLASPHYGDLIEPWLQGDYYPMTWTEEQVAAATRHTLTLSPATDRE